MEKKYLAGIDIGTSGCKITVFDFDGKARAAVTKTYGTFYPHSGWAEQDANDWWKAICEGFNEISALNNVDLNEIAAIGVDGTSWAGLPVDKNGNPLRNAIMWLDRRSNSQAKWMKDKAGEKTLIDCSGNPVDSAYITPKMLWIKNNESQIYKNAYKFVQSNAYIVYKLTDEFSQDYSQGYGFHFFDISKNKWNEKIAEDLGISLELMAPLMHCHEIAGVITKKASIQTGLPSGIPVAAGGLDAACCTLGAGVIKPGQTQEQGGQAGGMSIQTDKPLIHPRLILGCHVIPEQWLLQGGTTGGGGTLRWFNDELGYYEKITAGKENISSFEILSREAEVIPPSSDGLIFLPYMAGERSPIWSSKARGVLFGLSYDKTRSHIIRAIMEGVGFSLLHNLDTAKEVGAEVRELVSVGGSSNSTTWTQIKSDITGKVINVPYSDNATTLGAAILAGVGTGIYKNFEEAVNRTVHISRTHYPNEKNKAIYEKYYDIYLRLYENVKNLYEEL